jgi:hypothetical protein
MKSHPTISFSFFLKIKKPSNIIRHSRLFWIGQYQACGWGEVGTGLQNVEEKHL